jgi:hypothetical protein
MQQKAIRLGLAILFASGATWLFAYGMGLILDIKAGVTPVWLGWASSVQISRVFAHLAPIVQIGYWVGATFETGKGEVPCYIAGAVLYFAAAVALLIGSKKGRSVIALACWMNVMSLLLRIIWSPTHLSLLRALDVAVLITFLYLGFRANAGAFTPSIQASPQ